MQKIIPKASLRNWAIEKFNGHRKTIELMSCARNDHERAVIAIVALMEVDPGIRYQGMNDDEFHYIKSCHNYLLDLLEDPHIMLEPSAK